MTMGMIALLREELAEIAFDGPRARFATAAALSTGLAVLLALWLRVDAVWWAGISGFACSQANRPASVSRATYRILGTLAGGAAGLLAVALLIDDRAACLLFLLCCGIIGVLGTNCSPHSYAWLLGGITTSMVVTSCMEQPGLAVHIAVYRCGETTIGAVAALLVAFVLADPVAAPATMAPPLPWREALTLDSPVFAHAVRTGFALMLVPIFWSLLELPSVSQMAISIAAVMAVPNLGSTAAEGRSAVLRRGLHRLTGCAGGGAAGLALLGLSVEWLPGWLLLLVAGVWLGAHVSQSQRGIGYVGMQSTIALIVTMVQGWVPAQSLLPAVDRLTGMLCGLGLLLLVLLLTWPVSELNATTDVVQGPSR